MPKVTVDGVAPQSSLGERRVLQMILAIIGGLLCLYPANSLAQVAPGRSGSSTEMDISGQVVWDELSAFGECYASFSKKDAIKLISTQAASLDEAKTYKTLFDKPYQSCLGNVTELRLSSALVRGSIAQGLYLKKVSVPVELSVRSAPGHGQARSLSEAAICYAAEHTAAAQRLIEETKAGSRKDQEAIAALWPDFSQCLPPAATGIKFETMLVRFRIAEALWRLGVTSGSATSAPGAPKGMAQ